MNLHTVAVLKSVGRAGLVSTATRYELDGPGIESRWWKFNPHLSRPSLLPTQPTELWVPGLFPRKKVAGVALTTHPHFR